MPSVRVLVVEDNEPFRRFICSTLENRRDLQIVGIASDGLAAVQKAGEVRPDLVLLDVGLPALSGIEAARRILKLSPQSKIIFLTQESSPDVAQEAFNLGAKGYVVKIHAGSELLPAVEAVCGGGQFVSKGLSALGSSDVADEPRSARPSRTQVLPSNGPRTKVPGHAVQFYADDASLIIGFVRFIEAALESGNAVIVVATESHRQALLQRLQADGVDIAAATEQRCYIPLDASEMASAFMVDDVPDPVRFQKGVRDLFAAAATGPNGDHRCVATCGEAAPQLWAEGKGKAAVQIEHLWDALSRACNVDTLCGYVVNGYQRKHENHIYERICAEHSHVYVQ